MSKVNTKYRIQCIVNYEYHDITYDTVKELVNDWETLHLTRWKVNTIINRNSTFNKYPHILITKISE